MHFKYVFQHSMWFSVAGVSHRRCTSFRNRERGTVPEEGLSLAAQVSTDVQIQHRRGHVQPEAPCSLVRDFRVTGGLE